MAMCWEISDHAFRRFRQRVAPHMSEANACAWLTKHVAEAVPMGKRTPKGQPMWRLTGPVPGERDAVLVTKRISSERRIVVTVLYWGQGGDDDEEPPPPSWSPTPILDEDEARMLFDEMTAQMAEVLRVLSGRRLPPLELLQELRARIEVVQSEHLLVRGRLRRLTDENARLRQDIDDTVSTLRPECDRLQAENEKLKEQLERMAQGCPAA